MDEASEGVTGPKDGPSGAVGPGRGMAARFDVESGPATVILVEGELDAQTGSELRTLLARAFDERPDTVVVDLSGVDFIDSVGLSVLVTAHNRGESQETPFSVRSASPACVRVFEITRLVDVLHIT
ncbi:MAG TPA: STAS domain-containing protein [Acidimicrobiales bacterium]